jgi:hypothetical protein
MKRPEQMRLSAPFCRPSRSAHGFARSNQCDPVDRDPAKEVGFTNLFLSDRSRSPLIPVHDVNGLPIRECRPGALHMICGDDLAVSRA